MTYHRRNKNKTNRKVVIIIIILAILFLFGSNIKGVVHWTAVPILKVRDVVISPFESVINQLKFKQSLIDENEYLKKENRRLEIENLTVESLKKENQSLKEITNYVENTEDYITGKVLNRPPFSPYDTFIIGKGDAEIYSGDEVYYLGSLIGRITEEYQNTAVVKLNSTPETSNFVVVSDQSFEAIGIGGGGFVMQLPKDFSISEGEVIFINQKPAGKVDSIETDETGAFQKVYFRYPFNVNEIDFVQILRSKN